MKRLALKLSLFILPALLLAYSCSSSTTPPSTGSIRVTSVPTGAAVFLDGTARSMNTDCTLNNISVGSHTVKLTKAGYVDYQTTTSVTAGQMANVSATLTPVTQPGALSVTPAGGFTSTGQAGGPFTPASTDYVLQNTGGVAIAWTASATQPWITLSSAGGNLAAAATVTVTVSLNAAANALAAGTYNDTVTFTNTTNGNGNATRPVALTVTPVVLPGALSVTPLTNFTSTGPQGGPFVPANQAYILENTGGTAIDWTAASTQAWVALSSAGGNLAGGATIAVSVSLNPQANALVPGLYSDTVTFTNTTNAVGNTTRAVSLTVNQPSQVLLVTVDYVRVPPIPNPTGADFPVLGWAYGPTPGGTSGLTKVIDDSFTSPNIPLQTETVIRMWVTDSKMDNLTSSRVCRTISVNGQVLNVGTTLYGEAIFILGNNGVVRYQ